MEGQWNKIKLTAKRTHIVVGIILVLIITAIGIGLIRNKLSGGLEIQLISTQKTFQLNEEPKFEFVYKNKGNVFDKLTVSVLNLFRKTNEHLSVGTKVFAANGEEVSNFNPRVEYQTNGKFSLNIDNSPIEQGVRPGKYKIELEIKDGDKAYIQDQDFVWGVLAINTNKSIYLPDEKAYLQMAALNAYGHTLCDANLKLEITTPNGSIVGPEVQKSGECGINNVTDSPDYYAYFQVSTVGTYQIKLINLDNDYEISDFFEVRESVPFVVERIGATRINPSKVNYTMTIKVKANQDFDGRIQEQVPGNFQITEQQRVELEKKDSITEINWNLKIKTEEEITLQYEYDAPNISPQLYLLGPLRLIEGTGVIFEEAKQWQIASDDIETLRPNGAGDETSIDLQTPSSTFHWDKVDESTPDDLDTTVNTSATNYLRDLYALPDSGVGAGTINSVTVYIRVYWAGASNTNQNWYSISIKTNGTVYDQNFAHDSDRTTWKNKSYTWNTNPQTSAAWTWAEINALQAGVSLREGFIGGPALAHCTQVYVEVDYTPSSTVSISGTSDETSGTVKVAVNNTPQAQTGTVGATWQITGVTPPSSGDVITVWIDGANEADESTGVTTYSGSGNIAGLVLNRHVLSIGNSDNRSLTVTNLSQYTNSNDEDVMHGVSSSVLTVDIGTSYTDEKIDILSGNTLTIGNTETLTTHDIAINGTLTSSGNSTYNIGGSWDNNATFTASTSTVTFTATSGTETVDSTGAVAASFNNLTFGTGASSTIWNLSSALDVNGTLTISYGTLSMNGNHQINVAGATTINNSGLYAKDNTATAKLIFDGGVTQTLTSRGQDLGNIQTSTASTHLDLNDALDVDNVTIDTSTTLHTNNYNMTVAGNWANSGTFTAGSGTVTFDSGSTGKTINAGGSSFNNIQFNNSNGEWSMTGNGMTIGGTLTVTAGTFTVNAFALTVSGATSITGTLTISSATGAKAFNGNVTINNGGTWNNTAANVALTLPGSLQNNGTFNAGTGLYDFTGSTKTISGTNEVAIPNLRISGTIQNNGTLTVSAALDGSGTLTNGANATLNVGGTITVTNLTATSSGNTVNYTGGAQTVKVTAYYHLGLGGSGAKTFAVTTINGNLTLSGTATVSMGADLTVDVFDLNAGIFDQGANRNLTVDGNFTIAASGATFTKGTGTSTLILAGSLSNATFTGPATPQNLGAVQIGSSPGDVYLASDFAADSLTVEAGDTFYTKGYEVDIGSGGISLATGSPGGKIDTTDNGGGEYEGDGTTITDGGAFTINSGALFIKCTQTSRRSLVKMDGGGAANFTSDSEDIGDFQISTASTNITLQDDLNADAITIDGSTTLTANNKDITCAGNWSNSGTFTAGSGAVTFDGSSLQTLSGTMTGSSSFYDLTITNTSGDVSGCSDSFSPGIKFDADATSTGAYTISASSGNIYVEYKSGSTYTFNNITWEGTASYTIYFRNSNLTSGAWLLKVTGSQGDGVSYVDVTRSDASVSGGSEIDADDGTNTDCGNNTNWSFPEEPSAPCSGEICSLNYTILASSINVGGLDEQSSLAYKMKNTIGEIASDESASSSYKLKAGYRQMVEEAPVYISISATPNVNMPDLQAITGGTSNGTATINVTTNNSAGYQLTLNASTAPALKYDSAEFPDYTRNDPPDYDWDIGIANSKFGFTPWGEDTSQKYRYIGTDCNQSGGTADENYCWDGFEGSTELQIAQSSFGNDPSGTDTYVKYRAQIKSNGFQTPGNYSTIITATATVN